MRCDEAAPENAARGRGSARRGGIAADRARPSRRAGLSPIEIEAGAPRRRMLRTARKTSRPSPPGAIRGETSASRWQWPLSRLQSAILALIVANAIVVGWRGDFVRAMPQTASFYAWLGMPVNVRGLDFDGLATTTEQHDGVPILVIGGNIVNITGKTEDRAASALCRTQCRATGDLFLDGGAAAHRRCRRAKASPSTPGSLRRRRMPTTWWCVSSIATTFWPGHADHGSHPDRRR